MYPTGRRHFQTKRTRDSKSPWISNHYSKKKKRMNFRDRPKRKAIESKDPFISNPIRMIKNQVNYEINSAKKSLL